MDPATRLLIQSLHQSSFKYVMAVTGGGAGAAAALLGVPGGSRTVLEVVVPYGERSLADFLGRAPEHFCSLETARLIAGRARDRAAWLAPGEAVAGVACTASLATDRPKRGDHRFHLAVDTGIQTLLRSLTLAKGARDRAGEEAVLGAVLLDLMAEAFDVGGRVGAALLADEAVEAGEIRAADALSAFLRGETAATGIDLDGRTSAAPPPSLLVPGAFNPIHEGHWGLAAVATRRTGRAAAFELSVANVDKPPLSDVEVRRRLTQFAWRAPVWLTRAPTFVEKARLFPGAVFAVGADTAERVVAPRYYGDSESRMNDALAQIREQGCRFLVAGRVVRDGRFAHVADLPIPEEHRDLFEAIPAEVFRADVSSTDLRNNGRGGGGDG